MSHGFDEMWEAIHDARSQRSDVVEFRMSAETCRELIRSFQPNPGSVWLHTPEVEAAFGTPVVVDPRVPEGIILPVLSRDVEGWPMPVLAPTRPLFGSVDESHGMTLEELIPEVIEEWNRLRDSPSDDPGQATLP